MGPRTNREILTKGKAYATKQRSKFGAQEIEFNKDSRLDYLTGFHTRKLYRRKKAKEDAAEMDRLAKIEERKKTKIEREQMMDQQLVKFRESMGLDSTDLSIKAKGTDSSDEETEELEIKKVENGDGDGEDIEDIEAWFGFDNDNTDVVSDNDENEDINNVKPILKKEKGTFVYPDNTMVEFETLEPNENFEYLANLNNVKLEHSEKVLDQSISRAAKYANFLGMSDDTNNNNNASNNTTNSKNNGIKKKKQKKFRYLTKNERRSNQRKANNNKRRK